MTTFIETAEDRAWLRDVHNIDVPGGGVAILEGNEDWPETVTVYEFNHIESPSVLYRFDSEGNAYRV